MNTNQNSNRATMIMVYLSAAIIIFAGGYTLGQKSGGENSFSGVLSSLKKDPRSKDFNFDLFFDTMQKVEDKYVDKSKIDEKKMFDGAIKGMVASIDDPYTFFLTKDENVKMKSELAGKMEGIGAMLEMKDGFVTVISTLKNSPAKQAGIQSGDIITKVNGNPTKGQALDKVVTQIRGPKGTSVNLTIFRSNKESDYKITRDEIQTNSLDLSYETLDSCPGCGQVAFIQLHQFGDTTEQEWDDAVDEIQQKWANKEIKGLVIDLRNNPGGYLQSSVYLTSDFLNRDSLIVSQESKDHKTRYNAIPSQRLKDIPLTVIINKYSASAAEIMSGALKDYKRATLVGEKSFGKGSVQEALDLQDGAGLHVTVAKWVLPKGQWIHGIGIQPDVKVDYNFKDGEEYSKEKDAQMQKAIELLVK
jgi:carboxyl-terminal processing protease